MKHLYPAFNYKKLRHLARTFLFGNALILLFSTSLHAQPTATAPASGDGSLGDPYQIATLENLYWIAAPNTVVSDPNQAARWSSHYIQTVNIDASPTSGGSPWPAGGWTPIGNSTTKFTGSYDGQNHSISNLYISRSGQDYIGLFGVINNAEISNLTLTDVDITGGGSSIGNIGALAGRIEGTSDIDNCHVSGKVSGTIHVGGFVGFISDSGPSVSNSTADCETSGSDRNIGGFVGTADAASTVISSSSVGYVESSGRQAGGFAGFSRANISLSYSEVDVEGTHSTDGLIGGFLGSMGGGQVIDSYSRGSITYGGGNTTNSGIGGFVGGFIGTLARDITNCYSTGSVPIAGSDYGGFSGKSDATVVVNDCFWDTVTSGRTTSANGEEGKTTGDMKDQSTFIDWDFLAVWAIDGDEVINDGYPFLLWVKLEWEGGTVSAETDWHTAANWSTGAIPSQTAYITIPSSVNDPVISKANVTVNNVIIEGNAVLTVATNRLLTIRDGGELTINANGNLTIGPGGSLTAVGNLINNAGANGLLIESDNSGTGSVIVNNSGVQATVERYVAGGGWHLISAPVSGQGIGSFIETNKVPRSGTEGNYEYAMTHYDESLYGTGESGGWAALYTSTTNADPMISGKGYLTGRVSAGIFKFSGGLAHSQVNILISRAANGWNAIGNPFASAMGVTTAASSAQNFLGENASKLDSEFAALYIYDPVTGDYRIINNTGEDIDQYYIQPGQGFIVKSSDNDLEIRFTPEMQYHNNTSEFFKKSATTHWGVIRLKVLDGQQQATTSIRFRNDMTKGLDPTYDAGQYGADPEFKLYSRLIEDDMGTNFAIQALPDFGFEEMVIPLGFDFKAGGEVTFTADRLRLPPGAAAILEDRDLGIFTNLEYEDYTVILGENTSGPDRFFLHTDYQITSVEEIIEEPDREEIQIYSYGKEIFIIGEVRENIYATVYNMVGRKVKEVRLQAADRNSFRVDELQRGIYLVRVAGEGTVKTNRVFIE